MTRQHPERLLTTPLYTVAESARFLGIPSPTFSTWAFGYRRAFRDRAPVESGPVLSGAERSSSGDPSIPFLALAEGQVVAAFRRAGVSMQHIRKAVAALKSEIGLEYALASHKLFTDGASVLYDYAHAEDDESIADLTVVVSQQRVFSGVVTEYLRRIDYGDELWARSLVSPATPSRIVRVDPRRSFGQPVFIRGAARVEDVVDRWRSGDSLTEVAEDFGVPVKDVEDYLRVTLPAAACILR